MSHERWDRQAAVGHWARMTFGEENWTPRIRALRFIEEAIELCQALGVEPEAVARVAEHVYKKPTGTPAQEFGGCGVALLALAECTQHHADNEEVREMERVLSVPAERFQQRDRVKRDAGLT